MGVGVLGSEAIEMHNCIICFECTSEEFIVLVTNLDDLIANYSFPRGVLAVL